MRTAVWHLSGMRPFSKNNHSSVEVWLATVAPGHDIVTLKILLNSRGLPHLRAPDIVPCIISFSTQLSCFLMMV